MTRKAVFPVLVVCVGLVATAMESRGQGGPKLTAAQEQARQTFHTNIAATLDRVKARCGSAPAIVTDFENYDLEKFMATSGESRSQWERSASFEIGMACANVLEAIARRCPDPAEPGRTKGRASEAPPPKPFAVTKVACLFAGATKEADDDAEAVVRRNLTYADGVVTLRQLPRMANVDQTAALVLDGKARDNQLESGSACRSGGQCRSNLCRSRVCTPCSRRNACPSGFVCTDGTCWNERSAVDSSPSPSGPGTKNTPPKSAGKVSGAACKFASECESKICTAKYRCK